MKDKTDTTDFKRLIELMSDLAKAHNCLSGLEITAQTEFLSLVDDHVTDYAANQETITKSEAEIEVLILRHKADWFGETKSLKTPFGTISLRSSTKLEIKNEELTIVLIQQQIDAEEKSEGAPGFVPPSAKFIRQRTELDLEALEKLDDTDLQRLRIKRVTEDKLTVKPSKVDLGKAVKEAVSKEKAAA